MRLQTLGGAKITFFLAATRVFSQATLAVTPGPQRAALRSEDLFAAAPEAWDTLVALTGVGDRPYASLRENYGRKINSKSVARYQPTDDYRRVIEARLETLLAFFLQEESGDAGRGPASALVA